MGTSESRRSVRVPAVTTTGSKVTTPVAVATGVENSGGGEGLSVLSGEPCAKPEVGMASETRSKGRANLQVIISSIKFN